MTDHYDQYTISAYVIMLVKLWHHIEATVSLLYHYGQNKFVQNKNIIKICAIKYENFYF